MQGEEKNGEQAAMLANRLRKRFRHLVKWARRTGTDAFRLYDRDIPEIPLALDWYGGALAGSLYKRPYEKDDAEEVRWLETMQAAAAQALSIDPADVFIKHRERQRGLSQYQKIAGRRYLRQVHEGGLTFAVNLSDYLDTGLFLDRRLLRNMVRAESKGKRVLNLFSYTGSFSVYAAAGGAVETVSVDLSNTYLNWARDNFSLNGAAAQFATDKDFFDSKKTYPHRLVRSDALLFLDLSLAAQKTWDAIILDPPAFSNSKKMNGTLDLLRDYPALLSRCLALLAGGGKLWFSANARQFRTGAAELQESLKKQFPDIQVSDIGSKIIDEDFRDKKTPATFTIEKL
jgi:23S rRNA G2069 N7-methylase RlmK/C1962 C5-methylase RlmI